MHIQTHTQAHKQTGRPADRQADREREIRNDSYIILTSTHPHNHKYAYTYTSTCAQAQTLTHTHAQPSIITLAFAYRSPKINELSQINCKSQMRLRSKIIVRIFLHISFIRQISLTDCLV